MKALRIGVPDGTNLEGLEGGVTLSEEFGPVIVGMLRGLLEGEHAQVAAMTPDQPAELIIRARLEGDVTVRLHPDMHRMDGPNVWQVQFLLKSPTADVLDPVYYHIDYETESREHAEQVARDVQFIGGAIVVGCPPRTVKGTVRPGLDIVADAVLPHWEMPE